MWDRWLYRRPYGASAHIMHFLKTGDMEYFEPPPVFEENEEFEEESEEEYA